MIKVGFALLLLGAGSIGVYALYQAIRGLLLTASVPFVMRLGIPVVMIGLVFLILAVVRDRIRATRDKYPDEVDN